MDQQKGFIASLFDLSFKNFITSKLVTVLYVLSVVSAGLISLGMIRTAFGVGAGTGIFMLLIGGPLVFLISIIWARVILELIMVLFRISQDIAKIAAKVDEKPGLSALPSNSQVSDEEIAGKP